MAEDYVKKTHCKYSPHARRRQIPSCGEQREEQVKCPVSGGNLSGLLIFLGVDLVGMLGLGVERSTLLFSGIVEKTTE